MRNPNNIATFKRGSSFAITFNLPAPAHGRFTGWTLRAQMRTDAHNRNGGLIANIPATWTDSSCTAIKVLYHDTDEWALGPAAFDILLTDPSTGTKVHSATMYFNIERSITTPEGTSNE